MCIRYGKSAMIHLKMIHLKTILSILLFVVSFTGWSQGRRDSYQIRKGHIYFRNKDLGHSYHRKFILHKNPEYITFAGEDLEVLEWTFIYHQGHLLARPFDDIRYDAFLRKFQVIGEYHALDDSTVFFKTYKNEGHPHGPAEYYVRFVPIRLADRETFVFYETDQRYGRDRRYVYYGDRIIAGADPQTFEILSPENPPEFRMMKLHSGEKVKIICGRGLARDTDNLYWGGHSLSGFSPENITALGNDRFFQEGNIYEVINHKSVKLIKQ